MTKRDTQLTRRGVLAGLGAAGFATAGITRSRSTGSWNEYANYTYAQTTGPELLVGWRSTYNGTPVVQQSTSPAEFVEDIEDLPTPVALVNEANVLPGDRGTVSVGLRVENEDARVWMRVDPHLQTADQISLELNGRIELEVRYDTGIFGVGGCAGAESDFSTYGQPIASGAFTNLTTEPGQTGDLLTGVMIDPGLLDNGCLTVGDSRCLAFSWEFPTGMGNVGKGGEVRFDVEFAATECSNPSNPFGEST